MFSLCIECVPPSPACTYIGCNNPLRPLHVSAYFTLTGLENSDALVGKGIEHVSHTQPLKTRETPSQKEQKQTENGTKCHSRFIRRL